MANLPKDMADEVGKSKTAGGGNYIQHGEYIFMIDNWFYQKIQDRCIVLELWVAESKAKIVFEGSKKIEQEPNPVGSKPSSTSNFDGKGKQSAPSNSRAPMLALFGFKENEVTDAIAAFTMRQVCKVDDNDPELAGLPIQPVLGMLVACSTFPKEIQSNKGNYITGLNWTCVDKPGQGVNSPDQVKARLAALKVSPEEFVKVVKAQLSVARGTTLVSVPSDTSVSAAPAFVPPATGLHVVPPMPAIPVLPVAPPSDPLAGWKENPSNPEYYFRYINGVGEQKSKADLLAGR